MHIPKECFNPCRKAYPTSSLCFILSPSPPSHLSLTPQGSNRTPYLTPNLGPPCTSVYLLLTVNTGSLSLLCVSPSPLVEWLAGFVMLLSGIVVLFHGVHQGTILGPLRVHFLPALFDCVCGRGCCGAWFNLI